MESLANNLRIAREKLGLSQLDVSLKTGIGNKTISNYETDISSPDPESLIKLADAYKVSVDYLLGRRNFIIAALNLSVDKQYLLEVFSKLSGEGKTFLLQCAKAADSYYVQRSE